MFTSSQNKLQNTLLDLSRERLVIIDQIEYHGGALERAKTKRETIEDEIDSIIHKLGKA